MLILAAVAVLLVQNGQASEEEKIAATRSYFDCLFKAAEDLDDGISDAASVARGITPGCLSKLQAVGEVYGRGSNSNVRSIVARRFEEEQYGRATQVVLAVRKARRERAVSPSS